MKTTLPALLLLAFVACANVAQDVPPDARKVDTADLLARYLKADVDARVKLRAQLVQQPPADLQAAIAGLKFEKPARTGMLRMTTICPDGYNRPYWVWLPETYDPAKSYNLIVALHGGVTGTPLEAEDGSPGESMASLFVESLPVALRDQTVIVGASAGVPETHEAAAWWWTDGQRNVLHFVHEVKRRVNIDENKVLVSGLSDGGSGSFGFAYRMPDTFAGYFPMIGHPLVPTADGQPVFLENLKGSNIYAFNGGKDPLYPTRITKPLYEQANSAGASIRFTEHPDLGHTVSPVIKNELKLFADELWPHWKRDLLPKSIDWTTTSTDRGRRAWLWITEISNFGKAGADIPNAEIKMPGARVRLGVQLVPDSSPPKVEMIVKGSTAEQLGLKEGDAITKLDNTEIKTFDDLLAALGEKAPGDEVSIVIKRGKEELTLKGAFPKAQQQEEKPDVLAARVIASYEPGKISIKVRNAKKLTLKIHPDMLLNGKLIVSLAGSTGVKELAFADLAPSSEFILRQYEESGDRTRPFICELEIDVAAALGVKAPTKPKPGEEEDEF
ncbi:MAG: PDZ domain-containing protein [Planctomycetes bacterium]|nr:PDZ domain-containing protein [Planctomycetota bacterium]